MTDAIANRIVGMTKHWLALAGVAIFVALVVLWLIYYVVPQMNNKSNGKTARYFGPSKAGAATVPAQDAQPSSTGPVGTFSVA